MLQEVARGNRADWILSTQCPQCEYGMTFLAGNCSLSLHTWELYCTLPLEASCIAFSKKLLQYFVMVSTVVAGQHYELVIRYTREYHLLYNTWRLVRPLLVSGWSLAAACKTETIVAESRSADISNRGTIYVGNLWRPRKVSASEE